MSDNDVVMATCWYLEDECCPRCGYWLATDGRSVWCENTDVCGYWRKSMKAPLSSQEAEEPQDGA